MFLNYIKDFSVKRILKNNFQNTRSNEGSGVMKTIGLLVDESYFLDAKAIVTSLVAKGILEHNIEVLLYNDKIKKNKVDNYPVYYASELNWNATLNSKVANEFMDKEFDLLINYYELEKVALVVVSRHSKAKFTVGFSTVDKRLNDLIIKATAEEHLVFINETFKYLKILNKI
ncbi:hypothetical protein [Flavobacterium sp.]|uniref:DUF6913 domain-containing protein n=1 Tax=Flavobacterium sp. TaxID=239 RepID=UPI002621387D|nr:hypothetical protein [Flavobacterium sp.]MDG2431538.1 hypothetical protein [Flavobacterium sp.]